MRSIIPKGMRVSREMPSVGGRPKVSVGMPVYNGERYLEAPSIRSWLRVSMTSNS